MLMTIDEAAELLRTTPGAARGTLERLKLRPVNLGRGRGLGLRWYRQEILDALEESRTPKKKRKPLPTGSLFAGKSTADIMRELTSPTPRQ